MSGWEFTVVDLFAEPYAASPQLTARLRIEEASGQVVHAIALRCQVRIEPQRRGYESPEEHSLQSLFGGRERWSETLRPFTWMQCNTTVQGFTGATEFDLPMPVTYDFDVTGSRYLHAVQDGTVPIELQFSGTVFTKGSTGFGVEQVPWDCDTRYDLPVRVWQETIDHFFPSSGWLRLDRDTLDALADYRAHHHLVSWEETLGRLLEARSAEGGAVR